ncbi:hypothetical protein KHA96_11780 [Bacillus sp. FJAT-49711]|uniref:hypothetical protein n=1 Tax=Bacillus sp. FJAT-49711 TaxID=2833585 RepID=UPI001BCA0480|nr:hypothetical protein [Bacillus sp. FJAT-49711]MBS4218996.1 hypothetical protein [Bacillus sp. FJAT-49711]
MARRIKYPAEKARLAGLLTGSAVFGICIYILTLAISGKHFTGMLTTKYLTDPVARVSIPPKMIKTDLLV